MAEPVQAVQTVAALLAAGRQMLVRRGCESARLDAELLLAHALGRDRTAVYRDADEPVSKPCKIEFERLIGERADGRPVAQLVGYAEFWSMRIIVDEHVLIPRPETELLVEIALESIPATAGFTIAEPGTGSGAIALALARERPATTIVASDYSAPALRIAERNRAIHEAQNVRLIRSNWLDPLAAGAFDTIISNPPYVESTDPRLTGSDIRFEPVTALAAGLDGLDAIRVIVAQSRQTLRPEGRLLIEHGCDQGAQVRALFEAASFAHVTTVKDLAGHERVTCGTLSSACKR